MQENQNTTATVQAATSTNQAAAPAATTTQAEQPLRPLTYDESLRMPDIASRPVESLTDEERGWLITKQIDVTSMTRVERIDRTGDSANDCTMSQLRSMSVTSAPLAARLSASVEPNLPPPIIPTFVFFILIFR